MNIRARFPKCTKIPKARFYNTLTIDAAGTVAKASNKKNIRGYQ